MTEYVVLVGLIAAAMITAVTTFGAAVSEAFGALAGEVGGVTQHMNAETAAGRQRRHSDGPHGDAELTLEDCASGVHSVITDPNGGHNLCELCGVTVE